VDFAVSELGYSDRDFLRAFFRLLLIVASSLRNLFIDPDLLDELLCIRLILVKPYEGLLAHGVRHPCFNLVVSQLVFRLAFEDRVFKLDRDRADDSFPNVVARETRVRKLVDSLQYADLERGLMRPSVYSVLSVDEAEVIFAVIRCMSEGEFELGILIVDDAVKRRARSRSPGRGGPRVRFCSRIVIVVL